MCGHCAEAFALILNTSSLHHTPLRQVLVSRRNKKKSTLNNVRGNFLEKLTLQRLAKEQGARWLQKAWAMGSTWASSE